MKNNLVLQVVVDSLEALGVPKESIQKVPTLVRRAVVDLQRDDILPPRKLSFDAIERKREYRSSDQKLMYNYIELPKGFRKLDEFFVNDGRSPYQEVHHENYLESISRAKTTIKNNTEDKPDRLRLFSFTHINIGDTDAPKPALAVYPYPDDDIGIEISYFIDGTENSLNFIDETYHSLIVNKVEEFLGLRAPQSVDELAADMNRQWRNRKGKNMVNSTMTKTKPNPMFGRRRR